MPRYDSVEFHGERAGTEPLTWGQLAIWIATLNRMPCDHDLNIGRILQVPDRHGPVSVAAALGALGLLVARHESLRTLLRGPDDAPLQAVAGTGRLPVEIVTALPGDPGRTAVLAEARLLATAFDYRAEWPLRVCLVTRDGTVTHIVLGLCHLAADGHAADILVRDLRLALLRGALPASDAPQPLDISRWQRSAEGRRVGDQALMFWENEFRRIPAFTLPPGIVPEGPPFQRAVLSSAALDAALPAAAARLRVSSSAVVLAGWLALIGAHSGQEACAIRPIVNNRFHTGYRDVVSTISQEGLVVADTGVTTFDELVRHTWRDAMRAYRHARFDAAEVDYMIDKVRADRGPLVRSFGCFNDIRLVERPGLAAPPPDEETVRALLSETTLTWPAGLDELSCWFCVHIGGEPGRLEVSLTADTRMIAPADMEGFLRDLESLVVAAAFREVEPAAPAGRSRT